MPRRHGASSPDGHDACRHGGRRATAPATARVRRPRGGEVTVLATGTSAEGLLEGLTIGAGAIIEPRLAILIAAAIAVDNISEALSIGEIIRSQSAGGQAKSADRPGQETAPSKEPGAAAQPGEPPPHSSAQSPARSRGSADAGHQARHVLGWTGLIGVSVFVSALAG
jgi:hypothetical protein